MGDKNKGAHEMEENLGLSELTKSALVEILNIAASHSANTISDQINAPVQIISPSLNIITLNTLPEIVEESFESAFVVCGDLQGSISGSVVLFFPLQNSAILLDMLGGDGKKIMENSKENFRPIQEIGHMMLSSFAEAVSGFFGADVSVGNFFSGAGKVRLIIDHLKGRLDGGKGSSIFVNTNFSLESKQNICHLYLSLTPGDLDRLLGAEVPEFSDEFESLTDMVGAFEELTKIESRLNDYIENVDVPIDAKRRFLRSIDPAEFEKNRLRGLIINMLLASKVGDNINILQKGPFGYEFIVEGCKVCDIFPTEGTKSCYTTATALGRFFLETLGMGNEVEEIKCVKTGDPACVYNMKLESIDVFSFMPNLNDINIMKCLADGTGDMNEIVKRLEISTNDGVRSYLILEYYDILNLSEDSASLTDTGRVLLNFAQKPPTEEEKTPEDWDNLGNIKQKIHSSKPQETFEVGFEEAKAPWK